MVGVEILEQYQRLKILGIYLEIFGKRENGALRVYSDSRILPSRTM